jgi:hypothetical protein
MCDGGELAMVVVMTNMPPTTPTASGTTNLSVWIAYLAGVLSAVCLGVGLTAAASTAPMSAVLAAVGFVLFASIAVGCTQRVRAVNRTRGTVNGILR